MSISDRATDVIPLEISHCLHFWWFRDYLWWFRDHLSGIKWKRSKIVHNDLWESLLLQLDGRVGTKSRRAERHAVKPLEAQNKYLRSNMDQMDPVIGQNTCNSSWCVMKVCKREARRDSSVVKSLKGRLSCRPRTSWLMYLKTNPCVLHLTRQCW